MGVELAVAAGLSAYGAYQSSKAQKSGSDAQSAAIAAQMAQNQRNFETAKGYLSPYATSGQSAYQQALAGSGALGAGAQQQYMNAFTGGPYLTGMQTQAGNALNSQYAATGHSPYGGNATKALFDQDAYLWNQAYQQQLQYLYTGSGQGIQAAGGIMSGTGAQAQTGNQLTGMQVGVIGQQAQNQANMYSNVFGTAAKTVGGLPAGSISSAFGSLTA
jgi:hypothetical protein